MSELLPWEIGAIFVLFVWSGFVRSGLGFGGAVLTMPFLLMIRDEPLLWLPLISVHLLFFSGITVFQAHRADAKAGRKASTVNWGFLRWALLLMIIPKIIGVAGVITLPGSLISGFIFCLVMVYSVSYVLARPLKTQSTKLEGGLMMLGGYISGISLIAAPIVVPIAAGRLPKEQLRDTLFVLWFVLVGLKMLAFIATGVDLNWSYHLWLLPAATIGHFVGLRFHRYTLQADTKVFFRYLGGALLLVSLVGLARLMVSA